MGSPTSVLQLVTFLDLLSCGMVGTQLSTKARSLGGSHIAIGAMGALYAGFQMLCGPLVVMEELCRRSSSKSTRNNVPSAIAQVSAHMGSLSDLKGRKPVLIFTISISGFAYVLMGLTSSLLMFMVLRTFIGAVKHTQILTRALAPDYDSSTELRASMYGKLEALGGLGMSLAPIFGGHIMEWFPEHGFTIICAIVGTTFAVIAGLIKVLPKEATEKGKLCENKSPVTPKLINSISDNFKQSAEQFYNVDWKIYSELFLFRLLLTICTGLYFCNYSLYLRYQYNVSPSAIGYITSIFWTVSSFFIYFIEHINNFYKNPNDLMVRNCHVFLVLTLSFLGMLLAPNVLVFSVFVVSLATGTAVGRVVNMEVILNKTEKSHRGTVMGVARSVRNISGVLAPIIGGFVGQYIGILYSIHVCLALTGIATYRSYKNLYFDAAKNAKNKLD